MSAIPSTIPLTMIRQKLNEIIDDNDFCDQRVLIIVPDSTRTTPLHVMFPVIRKQLGEVARSISVLVALGTHPPMSQNHIRRMLGIAQNDPCEDISLHNHEWNNSAALTTIGVLTEHETRELSCGNLAMEVPVEINRRILDCDTVLIVGPVFPHEVVGFSGGNKYFFPGISGPRLLNFFHWLGALITNAGIIGIRDTPVRRVVDRAARLIKAERRCLAFVVASDSSPYAVFYGSPEDAWQQACDVSEQVHIKRFQRPYRKGPFLCTEDVRRPVGRWKVYVQARACRRRRRRTDYLCTSYQRCLDHPWDADSSDRLSREGLFHETMG